MSIDIWKADAEQRAREYKSLLDDGHLKHTLMIMVFVPLI